MGQMKSREHEFAVAVNINNRRGKHLSYSAVCIALVIFVLEAEVKNVDT